MKNENKNQEAQPVTTELYTAEASSSRRRAQTDASVPDPSAEDGSAAIERNTRS